MSDPFCTPLLDLFCTFYPSYTDMGCMKQYGGLTFYFKFKPFIPEFLKWTHSVLNLDLSIDAKRGFMDMELLISSDFNIVDERLMSIQ